MSAPSLESALASLGLDGRVEADGQLAILELTDPAALEDASLREQVTALATRHGFSHVALELGGDTTGGAALPRD